MRPFEIFIICILVLGIVMILFIIFRDPILILKTFLRGLKADRWEYKIILFPLWGPIWLIDKIFKLELYISNFEEASHPKQIDFSTFQKFIQVKIESIDSIRLILQKFQSEFDPETYNFPLTGLRISYSPYKDYFILNIEGPITFSTYNNLTYYLDDRFAKGILLNKNKMTESYYLLFDSTYPLRLIGKTYNNQKMYVDLMSNSAEIDKIFFNSNIDYIERFNFDKFESQIETLHFTEILI